MKKTLFMFMALLSVMVAFTSCSSDDDNNSQTQSNGVSMTVSGSSSIAEDDTEGITVDVMLAYAPTSQQTITLSLTGNDNDVARIDPTVLTISAGQKTAQFKIFSNNKSLLLENCVLTVNATFSDNNMKLSGSAPQVTITPKADMPALTDAQKQLIEGYKTKYGIDLTKVLGKIKVSSTVTFNDDDKATYNEGYDHKIFTGATIITLSDEATADKPVLKMTSNPMGLTTFLYDMLRKQTVDDNEYFMQMPYNAAVMAALNYDATKETFEVTLDGIAIDPTTGNIDFTAVRLNEYEEPITIVPFDYTYSVWERLKSKAEAGESVTVDDGEEQASYTLTELINDYGVTLNPSVYLGTTTIDTNYWENNLYVSPAGEIDFKNGSMTFTFPWDFQQASGYEQINVSYSF